MTNEIPGCSLLSHVHCYICRRHSTSTGLTSVPIPSMVPCSTSPGLRNVPVAEPTPPEKERAATARGEDEAACQRSVRQDHPPEPSRRTRALGRQAGLRLGVWYSLRGVFVCGGMVAVCGGIFSTGDNKPKQTQPKPDEGAAPKKRKPDPPRRHPSPPSGRAS